MAKVGSQNMTLDTIGPFFNRAQIGQVNCGNE
jgi:hypothetical protein